MDDLISEFIQETEESLSLLDQEMVRFEQDPTNQDMLSNIFRVMHTIKGTCGFLGLPRLERVAHAGEDVLGKFRDGELDVNPAAVSLILKSIDQISELLSNLSDQGEEGPITEYEEQLIAELRAMADGSAPDESPAETPEGPSSPQEVSAEDPEASDTDVPLPEGFPVAAEFLAEFEEATKLEGQSGAGSEEHPDAEPHLNESAVIAANDSEPTEAPEQSAQSTSETEQSAQPASQTPAPTAPEIVANKKKERPTAPAQSIRVNVEVLEKLMTMVSEMVLTRNQLLQLTRAQGDTVFKEPVQLLSRITSELQEGVMKTRMQPIGNAWNKLPRIVRDLSAGLDKKIDLVMSGEDTELDRQVLELIQDPLTHMVRNSVDHGVETPEDRVLAGKSENGTIHLSAYHEGGHIIIQVKDDGKGLDTNVIRKKIVEKELATAEEVELMDDAKVNRFILEPGFSTAKAVTKVSGRGVGMDVVRSNIEKISGTIDFSSTYGVGSTFTIKIPLTLAIVAALLVECSGQRYAIPQIAVSEVVRISPQSEYRVEELNGAPVLRLRNKLLPMVNLTSLLSIGDADSSDQLAVEDTEGYVVVCRVGNQPLGILVDRIDDSEEIVVKPLSSIIPNTTYYSGNTILGDGTVILILDTNGLASTLTLDASQLDTVDNSDAALSKDESILVFKTREESLSAVPLSDVHRIESFDMSAVEIVQENTVIQYRDRLLPLVSTIGPQGVRREGTQTVLVFGHDDASVGLAIEHIVDIMEDELKIEQPSNSPAYLGSAIVGECAVDVLDPSYFLNLSSNFSVVENVDQIYGEAA